MDERDEKKINSLIMDMLDEDDDGRRQYLADNILEIDPGNPVAKYIKWQSIDDPDALHDTTLLEEAINSLRPEIESLDEPMDDESDIWPIYVAMLADLASCLYISGDRDRALEAASEFMKLDRDGGMIGRAIYYAILTERGDFEEVIRAADDDMYETLPGEYCRAIAVFEQDGFGEESARYLLDAISLDPDIPYYILGLWTIDGEIEDSGNDDGYIEDMMIAVSVLSEIWSANEERLAFLSAIAFAFGYITGRVESPEDMEMIEESCRELGCLEDIKESRDIIHAMLAAGKDQEETDEKAIFMFRENGYFGMID
ncbi:MAG: hypothetical protein LBU26_06055 [Synergistaceae bacterium]|jgi:tetratricopeptide (TPR) repeat protein|nr:hypothetical protein [Synergistaceae bacterium]